MRTSFSLRPKSSSSRALRTAARASDFSLSATPSSRSMQMQSTSRVSAFSFSRRTSLEKHHGALELHHHRAVLLAAGLFEADNAAFRPASGFALVEYLGF